MKEIYNEGRIVGLSSYELFVRQQLSEDPNATLPSEKEWLASTLGNGNTMLLKIPANSSAGWHDFVLPETSFLAAASTIVGSIFVGEADFEGDWGVRVTSYGDLIANTYELNPETPGTTVPASTNETVDDKEFNKELSDDFRECCLEYSKIVDGICYQPGTWNEYMDHGVGKEFTPDPSYPPVVRIRLSRHTERDFYVLLQGFLSKSVLSGMTGFESGMDTSMPEDGDFLGPMVYPWATKIIFSYSSEVQTVLNKMSYTRKLPLDSEEAIVDSKPIVDFTATNPGDYYQTNHQTSNVPIDVTQVNVINDDGASVLAAYQKDKRYAPALYGAKVTETGETNLSPIDSAAPGTIRVFRDRDLAVEYPGAVNNVYGVYQNENDTLHMFDENGADINLNSEVKVKNTAQGQFSRFPTGTGTDAGARTASNVNINYYTTSTQSGDETVLNPSLVREVNGQQFDVTGSADTDIVDTFNWATLMTEASQNRTIGVIRDDLKKFRDNHLANMMSRNYMNDLGTVDNYMVFSGSGISGKRLYISSTAPSGARAGDIGIGW